MRLQVIQHVPFEGPAAIAEWARDRGWEVERSLLAVDGLPDEGAFDMLAVMGGPMGVYDERAHPWLAPEKRLLASVIEGRRTPVLGVCLGAQLLAEVLSGGAGSAVTRNSEPEIGWFPVELTAEGAAASPFAALPERFDALHWHGDTFAIPPGAIHAARSEACENQAFSAEDGRVVGLQFHLELTRLAVELLAERCADELASGGRWVSSAKELVAGGARFERARELLFALLDAMAPRP